MMALFSSLAPWKKVIDIAVIVALLGVAVWIYLALVNRAERINTLTAENGQLSQAANDNAKALTETQNQLTQTTAALKVANQYAALNAALSGQLKERISHAPKNGCIGPAERTLLDGLRTDALNRRSQVPQPVAP